MIKESDRLAIRHEEIRILTEQLKGEIKRAGVYERLLTNEDFKEFLGGWEEAVKVHQWKIELLLDQRIFEDDPTEISKIDNQILRHSIRMDQTKDFINHLNRTVLNAVKAREELKEIQSKENPNA